MKKLSLFLIISFVVFGNVFSNNLRISDGTKVSTNQISFAMSWENSWYVGGAPSNHDAIWVFIKYRECGGTGPYIHALLSTTMSDHIFDTKIVAATPVSLTDRFGNVPAGATETNGLGNNTGIMIRRSDFGKGDITSAICTLKVVSSAGDPFLTGVNYEIKVIGIEMVYVRGESFVVGDNGLCNSSFKQISIDNENALAANALLATNPALPAEYPKGYNGFYCMKYEISEGQFFKFMSTGGNIASGPSDFVNNNRNNLKMDGTDTPDRAQNYMSWNALMAYLDWAALRPMTELEYEKACKGSGAFSAQGYAWGSVSYMGSYYVSGAEDGTETVATLNANAHCYERMPTWFGSGTNPPEGMTQTGWVSTTRQVWGVAIDCSANVPAYPTPNSSSSSAQWYLPIYMCGSTVSQGWGPLGVGIYARDSTLSRETTGATYYGIMEMSGNVIEQCVDILTTTYTGLWGNGYLSGGGANVTGWPSGASARCLRGGGYSLPATNMRVCDRQYNNVTHAADWSPDGAAHRKGAIGGRGVR